MTDDLLISLSKRMENDLWHFVADAPPDLMVMKDLCAIASQLRISQIITERDGCSVSQAEGFVVEADRLMTGVDRLGAAAAGSYLADASRDAQAFASALLDMLVAKNA